MSASGPLVNRRAFRAGFSNLKASNNNGALVPANQRGEQAIKAATEAPCSHSAAVVAEGQLLSEADGAYQADGA